MNLPEEIINKIISYVDDMNSYQCKTCIKKISCIDNYIYYGSKYKFCSKLCFEFL